MDQNALILTQGLTTATLQCTVKPLFFFFLTKSQPFNKKQNITNTKNISPINRKINHKNNHNKQPTQPLNQKRSQNKHDIQSNNTPRFFEYYNIANGNCFRANHKYAFYKNSTQPHKKNHGQQHYEIMYYKHEKETFHIFG